MSDLSDTMANTEGLIEDCCLVPDELVRTLWITIGSSSMNVRPDPKQGTADAEMSGLVSNRRPTSQHFAASSFKCCCIEDTREERLTMTRRARILFL